MKKIINSVEGLRLYELDKFHSMLSDDYLFDKDNIQTKFIFDQFFNDKSLFADQKLQLLNISYSLASLITEKFADYVGEPTSTLNIKLDDYVSAFIWGGLSVFVPRIVNSEFKVDYLSPDEYVLEDDGSERLLTYYQVSDTDDNVQTYILEQLYNRNQITRTLFKVSKFQKFRDYSVEGDDVPLNTISATANLEPTEIIDRIDFSPLVKVHNRKLKGVKYGTSEIRKVRSLISSIEIEAVNIQDQFLKHLQAKLAIPNSAMKIDPKTGIADIKGLEVFGMEGGDALPSYIVNSNPLIDKSFAQIEDFLRQICAVLTIPTEFMGLKDGGTAESADTKKIRLISFIKKVEKIRSKFEDAMMQLNEIKKMWGGKADDILAIEWPSIFPDDPQILATELQTAQDAKLISNIKAIMRFNGIDEEEAKKEQAIINAEKATIDTSVVLPN
ncbi:MAG: hypothetical protein V4549_03535 [Bacteroidota bacterium]